MISRLEYDIDERTAINVRGVIALRWVAVVGQLVTILGVHLLGITLPLKPLLLVLAATATLNAGLMIAYRWRPPRRASQRGTQRLPWQHVLGLSMLCDLVALTLLLYFTGGMANPFSLFYFVNLVLAAILLPRHWVWALSAIAIACVASLFVNFHPLEVLQNPPPGRHMGFDVVKMGSLLAYATCAIVIVIFTTRISNQLQRQERRFRELADLRARSERLESLGTLAAGAAHELATPLSTIAVITKEVEREVASGKLTDQTVEDIRTVRTELDRCRDILDRMSADAGLVIGESLTTTTIGALVRESVDGAGPPEGIEVFFADGTEHVELRTALHGLAQAIRGIVKNAVDATGSSTPVKCHVAAEQESFIMRIQDAGPGIDAETLRRIGEPFFTTKAPGKGTGLGVYLARNVIERLGGTLEFTSSPGEGTCVTVNLPLNVPTSALADDDVGFHGRLF